MDNNETTLSSNLERIKDAVDDIREATATENDSIEDVAQAVYDLAHPNVYSVKTFAEMQAISNPSDGDVCHIYNPKLIKLPLGEATNVLIFPKKIVFDEALPDNISEELTLVGVCGDTETKTTNGILDLICGENCGVMSWNMYMSLSLIAPSGAPGLDKFSIGYNSIDGKNFTLDAVNCYKEVNNPTSTRYPYSIDDDISIGLPFMVHTGESSGHSHTNLEEFIYTFDSSLLSEGEYTSSLVLKNEVILSQQFENDAKYAAAFVPNFVVLDDVTPSDYVNTLDGSRIQLDIGSSDSSFSLTGSLENLLGFNCHEYNFGDSVEYQSFDEVHFTKGGGVYKDAIYTSETYKSSVINHGIYDNMSGTIVFNLGIPLCIKRFPVIEQDYGFDNCLLQFLRTQNNYNTYTYKYSSELNKWVFNHVSD